MLMIGNAMLLAGLFFLIQSKTKDIHVPPIFKEKNYDLDNQKILHALSKH
jgi:hypothetical protein